MRIIGVNNLFINNKFNYNSKEKAQILNKPSYTDTFVNSQVYFTGTTINVFKLMKQVKQLTKAEALAQGYIPVYTAGSLHKALSRAKESTIHGCNTEDVQKYLNTPRQKIILMKDIKLDKTKQINWVPIETFGGDFNGNGHKISGLRINQPQNNNVGLFKSIKNAKIENLILEDVNVVGVNNTGAIVGINNYNFNNTSDLLLKLPIENCLVNGTVIGNNKVGGMAGNITNAVVVNCIANVKVIGSECVGGLIGNSNYSDIKDSISNSVVSGKMRVGGCIGYNVVSSLENLTSKGSVKGERFIGGVIGYTYWSNATKCINKSTVSGIDSVNQIFGEKAEFDNIIDCVEKGKILITKYSP